jgi:hypothetical protein
VTAALPAVMTLTPGAAQALVSVTCGDKALDSGLTAQCILIPPSQTDDGHFRLPVSLYDKLVWVQDAWGQWVQQPNNVPTYFKGVHNGAQVWRSCATGAVIGASPPEDCNPNPMGAPSTGYAIVHISADDGDIVSVGSPTSPTNAIITSAGGACMASLAMRAG